MDVRLEQKISLYLNRFPKLLLYFLLLFLESLNGLTLSRRHKTCIILLWLTPGDFTRQRESSRLESFKITGTTDYSDKIQNNDNSKYCQHIFSVPDDD